MKSRVVRNQLNYGSGIGVTAKWKHVLFVTTTQSLLTFHFAHQICYLVHLPENETLAVCITEAQVQGDGKYDPCLKLSHTLKGQSRILKLFDWLKQRHSCWR